MIATGKVSLSVLCEGLGELGTLREFTRNLSSHDRVADIQIKIKQSYNESA